MRYELILVWVFVWTCSVASGDEVTKLSRHDNLLAAAKHLKAAGFNEKAAETLWLAKIVELEHRAKELVAKIPPTIDAQHVVKEALLTIRKVQQKLERLLLENGDAVAKQPLMMMLTPGGPYIQEEEEERILGTLP